MSSPIPSTSEIAVEPIAKLVLKKEVSTLPSVQTHSWKASTVESEFQTSSNINQSLPAFARRSSSIGSPIARTGAQSAHLSLITSSSGGSNSSGSNSMKRVNRKRRAPSSSGLKGTPERTREYIVERILDRRMRNGSPEYLLKWAGYSNAHNSWEPEDNILSEQMVADFNERYEQQHNEMRATDSPIEDSADSKNSLLDVSAGGSSSASSSASVSSTHSNVGSQSAKNSKKRLEQIQKSIASLNKKALPKPIRLINGKNFTAISSSSKLRKAASATASSLPASPTGSANSSVLTHGRLMDGITESEEEEGTRKSMFALKMNVPVEEILGATKNSRGELLYLVRWKNWSGAELVPSRILEQRQPHVVLNFFRSHCKFS